LQVYNNNNIAQKNTTKPVSSNKRSWGGAPTERISTRNSTSKGSWGRPPTERERDSIHNEFVVPPRQG